MYTAEFREKSSLSPRVGKPMLAHQGRLRWDTAGGLIKPELPELDGRKVS